jgi:hypothetical protein
LAFLVKNYFIRQTQGLLMMHRPLLRLAGCLCLSGVFSAQADSTLHAPPPAAPIRHRVLAAESAPSSGTHAATAPQLYSIGDPTNEEQLYLEFINRARANPTAEGQRLAATTDPAVLHNIAGFGVDLNLMQQQFANIPATPPLSMSARLIASSRQHSNDMLANQFQAHTGTDGSSPDSRMTAQGFNWTFFGENIFSFSESVFFGHAGFEIDWGGDPATQGGMQTPPGHRDDIHSPNFREVGIGVINGRNGANPNIPAVGPEVVTQDFGTEDGTLSFITGVVYFDGNGNGFYDVGEGIGGVTVSIPGADFFAITSASGGYSVPTPFDDDYTISFSGGGVADAQKTATVAGQNVKVDYVTPAPPPPVFANVSTRLSVGTSDNVLIGGFIITGTQPKKVIVRAVGPIPSVPGQLADPKLALFDSTGMIASNDNWRSDQQSEIIASGVAPSRDSEAAIVRTLPAGNYTAVVSGANDSTGIALVEVYDLDRTVDSKLGNISTRGFVQTNDNVMIGGVIVLGQSPAKFVVRGRGPSLGVPGSLLDPTLDLFDVNGVVIGSNDNWRTNEAAINATGLAPQLDAEAAIVATVPPGNYTAIVRGANGTTGVALVEAFNLTP